MLNQYLLGAIRISVDLRQSKINQYCRSSDKIVNFETKILIPFRLTVKVNEYLKCWI